MSLSFAYQILWYIRIASHSVVQRAGYWWQGLVNPPCPILTANPAGAHDLMLDEVCYPFRGDYGGSQQGRGYSFPSPLTLTIVSTESNWRRRNKFFIKCKLTSFHTFSPWNDSLKYTLFERVISEHLLSEKEPKLFCLWEIQTLLKQEGTAHRCMATLSPLAGLLYS